MALFLIFLFLQLDPVVFAGAANKAPEPLEIRRISVTGPLKPGSNGLLKIELSLRSGHMAYADKFKIKTSTVQIKNSKISLAPLTKIEDPHSSAMKEFVTENFALETVIEIPEDIEELPANLGLELQYQACTKKYCYSPRTIKVNLPQG